jgi:hypothetical protein
MQHAALVGKTKCLKADDRLFVEKGWFNGPPLNFLYVTTTLPAVVSFRTAKSRQFSTPEGKDLKEGGGSCIGQKYY